MSAFLPEGFGQQPQTSVDLSAGAPAPSSSQSDIALMQRVLATAANNPNLMPENFMAYMLDWIQTQRLIIPIGQVVGYSPTTASARVSTNAAQSITTGGTGQSVAWDQVDFSKPDSSNWSSDTPSQLLIQTSGRYEVGFCLNWAANATGIRDGFIRHNGSTELMRDRRPAITGGSQTFNAGSLVEDFVVGDYVELVVVQDSGGSLNLGSGSLFWIARVA